MKGGPSLPRTRRGAPRRPRGRQRAGDLPLRFPRWRRWQGAACPEQLAGRCQRSCARGPETGRARRRRFCCGFITIDPAPFVRCWGAGAIDHIETVREFALPKMQTLPTPRGPGPRGAASVGGLERVRGGDPPPSKCSPRPSALGSLAVFVLASVGTVLGRCPGLRGEESGAARALRRVPGGTPPTHAHPTPRHPSAASASPAPRPIYI